MENKRDYLNGDHSFKKWFSIMWKNKYIHIFVVGFTAIIIQLFNFNDMLNMIQENFYYETFAGIIAAFTMLLPLIMTFLVVYKGFIQFWNDLRSGNSR